MITKDINGNYLPASYQSDVSIPPRNWSARLYSDGVLLDCAIKSLEISKGSCGSTESFAIGNVYSNMLNAELLELDTDIKGTDIEVQIALNTTWITVGHFIAIEVKKTAYSTSVTGYGYSTAKASGSFAVPEVLTLSNIAMAIGTAMGCIVSFDGINSSYQIAGSIEGGTSCYAGLQLLAHLCGGYAIDTNDGNVKIKRFSSVSTLSASIESMRTLPDVEELNFTITGVSVEVPSTDEETEPTVYTDGDPIVLYDTNPNMSADIFNNIYKGIVGYSYKTGTIDLTLGDPRIEGDDVLSVTDINGNVYIVPCHTVKHRYDGGLSTSVHAVKAPSSSEGMATGTSITQKMDDIALSSSIARTSAERAVEYAEDAKRTTDEINAYAEQAEKSVTQILADGEQAGQSAQQALESAQSANASANSAISQLGIVENIVGVLDLVAKNGDYQLTTDTEVQNDKWYFTRSGSGTEQDPYSYAVVTDPEGDPSAQGWYELVGVDSAIQNYVSSHLALVGNSLFLQNGEDNTKIELSTTEGVVMYDSSGAEVAKYGATTSIGNGNGFHITMDGQKLGFWRGSEDNPSNEIAYITGQKLYITQSVVLEEMAVGKQQADGGLGQWSWKVHPNDDGLNNLYLKWIG